MTTVAEVLRSAAHLIDDHGHYQGKENGSALCALTGINAAAEGFADNYTLAYDAFNYLMYTYLGFNSPATVYKWNDNAQEGEVQTALMVAADQYESGMATR